MTFQRSKTFKRIELRRIANNILNSQKNKSRRYLQNQQKYSTKEADIENREIIRKNIEDMNDLSGKKQRKSEATF